jgi:hypothetical protein
MTPLVSTYPCPLPIRPRYLYLYVSGSPSITMYCKNPNPNIIRSSMHACVLPFLPAVAFLVHALFPKIAFFSALAYFQQAPNIDTWLIPSHLTFVSFINLLGDCLELLPKLCWLHLSLRGLLLECVYCLRHNLVTNQPCTFFLGLCHICLGFLYLCNDFCYSLLKRFHFHLTLLFLSPRSGELCL